MVFLRQIDAHGFKSFADKVNIKFDSGVTAVVGPNGSGKSNITDAIRWVLGEQSARVMRGAKMEDIIFDGTDNRQSMASASVSLILDNTDKVLGEKDEVIITRKLYRNGDSEYFINNEKSKLRDITELFMDSGLGKNAYNIISQGQVDEILKAKPLERRKLIEEAAGVMKYKSRKLESEKKLDDTKVNLSRVNDIIQEISSRVERLERESAIAEEYLALKEEMTESDIEVTVYDTGLLLERFETLQAAIKTEEEKLTNNREQLQALLENQEHLGAQRDEFEGQVKNLNEDLLEASRALEKVEGRITLFEERETNKESLKEDLNKRLKDSQKEVERLREECDLETDKKDNLLEEARRLSQKITNKKRELNVLESGDESDLESLKDQYYQLMVDKTTLENDKRRNQDQAEKTESNITYKKERLNNLQLEINRLKEEHDEESKKGTEVKAELLATRSDYKETKLHLQNINNEYDQAKSDFNRANNFISNQQAKLDMLKNMEDNYQGYYPGVRAVLKNQAQIPGVIGAVGELISTTPEYMTALDTALGQASQNIVMDVEHNARGAINYLKKQKLGFATFLPLDTIRERHLSVDIERQLASSGVDYQILSEVTDIDRSYRSVLLHLLNTTVVVKDLTDASNIARQTNQRVKIITLKGDIIMPGGAMSGGSKNRKGSIMDTKKEIQEITLKIEEYKSQTKRLKNTVDTLGDEIASYTVQLSKLESKGQALAKEDEEITQTLQRLSLSLENRQDTIDELNLELSNLSVSESREDLNMKIEDLTNQMADIQTEINMMSRSKEDQAKALELLRNEIQSLNNDKINKEADIRYTTSLLERLHENLKTKSLEVDKVNSELDMIDDDLSNLDIDDLNANKASLSQTVNDLEVQQEHLDDKLSKVKEEILVNTGKDTALRAEIDDSQNSLRSLSSEREGIDTQIENKFAYISDNYKMTYELAKSKYTNFENIDDKRQKILLNKKSIEELGSVNLGAIDEFKTVNERYTFLKEQEDDLIEARQTLLDVISEMDIEVSERFEETFLQVNIHFQDVFTEMFGGGKAELRLTDPGNYLDSGIEIFAQPPGKKLASLSLLSGGERALTAISLLFAVLKVKVSPFIILDEVEAALDEANVLRYAKYLKKLSVDTQFIVITHRKGTMEEADRLFGVTMQEQGVTKMISVDLKNYKDPGVKREEGA